MTTPISAYAFINPKGYILVDTQCFKTPEDAWRIGLGWPDQEEIDKAKRAGYRVERVTVIVDSPNKKAT